MNCLLEECTNYSDGCLSELKIVDNFFYLGNNIKSGSKSKVAGTGRIGLDWKAFNSMSFRLCGEKHERSKNKFMEHV